MLLLDKVLNWLRFNIRYLGNPPWDTNQSPPEILAYIQSHQPGTVLDLGCGTGKNCLTLAQAGWRTTGMDFVPKAILFARRRFKKANLQGNFLLADVSRLLGMDAEFDLVLDMGCFHALPFQSREDYRAVIKRVLKPGGDFLLYGHLDTGIERDDKRLTPDCIDKFQHFLDLKHREDGEDRGKRKSVWLWFKKPEK
jgi:ubiquinone/menaquinone biosynthesis C-methylase UbiE